MNTADVTAAEAALVEAMARAMCEWNGLTWEEARRPADADGNTEAHTYAAMAEDTLAAARTVTIDVKCERCRGKGGWPDKRFKDGWRGICPDCSSGTRQRSALAIIAEAPHE